MNADDARALGLTMIAVRRLAAGADAQTHYLEQLGTAPNADEFALEFDDSYKPLNARLAESDIPNGLSSALQRLDELLLSFSGPENADLWTTRALTDAPQWREVRRAAQHVIDEATVAGLNRVAKRH